MRFARLIHARSQTGKLIHKQAKKDKDIIYGGKSVDRQMPFYLRKPSYATTYKDYDIFSRSPKNSAKKLERSLDREAGADLFYVKPALHPGTHKVMSKGFDFRKGTKDDEGIADYTKMPRGMKFVTIGGIRYSRLSYEKAMRLKSLRDKEFAFRHQKDRDDLTRMRLRRRYKRY